ncbi:alpha/beta hydrolase family protein [Streptomyces sp. NPDC013187]|uniref:alpha/beta hydrolase family protein n=1 Tax=Streptomyces sp. NPDC013187 TaxID=3364865 RepID=UPI003675DAC5
MQHGTADGTCPPAWSREAATAFRKAGTDVELRTVPGEGHTFGAKRAASLHVTEAFFARHLR